MVQSLEDILRVLAEDAITADQSAIGYHGYGTELLKGEERGREDSAFFE